MTASPIAQPRPATRFLDLLQDLHDLLKLPFARPDLPEDPDADEMMAVQLTQGETKFIITHDPMARPQHATLACLMGPPPEAPEAALPALVRVLESNAHSILEDAGMFSLQPGTGLLVFSFALPLAGASAAGLVLAMAQLVQQAEAWRRDGFAGTSTPVVAATPPAGTAGWVRA